MLQNTSNLETVKSYLKSLENRKGFEDVLQFYHPDVVQTEYPNTVTKNITERTIADLRNASEKGKQLLQKEAFEIVHAYEMNDTIIIEAVWKGTVAIALGQLAAGDVMTAYFAQFFQFKDGKIFRQRNYDCFEPFS